MRAPEVDRLLWELVDGEIAPADRTRLEAHLADDPAARARLEEMRALSRLLGAAEELPVPESLEAGVARALEGRRAAVSRPEPWSAWFGELLAPRWRVRLAWSAAGLAVGIAVAVLFLADLRSRPGDDVTRYWGAIGHPARPGDGAALVEPFAGGRLTLRREAAALVLDLEAARGGTAPLHLEVDGAGLAVAGLLAGGPASVETSGDGSRVALTFEAPSRTELRVTTGGVDAAVTVRVREGGRVLLERAIRVQEIPTP